VRGSRWQCATVPQWATERTAVCGSVRNIVWQCTRQFAMVAQQCAALRVAVCGSLRQLAAVRQSAAAMCGSACGSVQLSGFVVVCGSAAVCGTATMRGTASISVRQCTRQCAAVRGQYCMAVSAGV
jgi:hypothetical protein